MAGRRLLLAALCTILTVLLSAAEQPGAPLFTASDRCIACHNGLVNPAGEDLSIGSAWRSSMMANAARDPYWQAGVRREITEHPEAAAEIENECSACHMPMTRFEAKMRNEHGRVFAHLPVGSTLTRDALLSADGVSCSVCHQITAEKFGTPESFSAGFVVDTAAAPAGRRILGPFEVDQGRRRIMHSATNFTPASATHLASAEMCATCHTLFTHSIGPDGVSTGQLPEQVPYLEWKHSSYAASQSCQSCHMKTVEGPASVTSVMATPRHGVSEHRFRGGNVFMARILDRYRAELGVSAPAKDFSESIASTLEHLQSEAAALEIERVVVADGAIYADVLVLNRAGHKLPTAYPSRRAWLHVVVSDASGRVIFESGALQSDGSIAGNDNDAEELAFEPHHTEINDPSQVQIYETVMADHSGKITTGLLAAVRFVKDNRVLPEGFAKATAPASVAVHGGAAGDPDFEGGSDRVRYIVPVSDSRGPFTITAELWYQPVAHRWAQNLRRFDALEPQRFVQYYQAMAGESAVMLARAEGASDSQPATGP